MNKSSPKTKHTKLQVTANPQAIPLPFSSFIPLSKSKKRYANEIISILNHPKISFRIASPPKSKKDIDFALDKTHDEIIVVKLRNKNIVGVLYTTDAHSPEFETWIRNFAILPKYQNKGIGRQLLEFTLYWTYSRPSLCDDRWREKIYLGITQNKGHEVVDHLAYLLQFEFRQRLWGQMGIQEPARTMHSFIQVYTRRLRYSTIRYELPFHKWLYFASSGAYPHLFRWGLHTRISKWCSIYNKYIARNLA